MNVVDNEVLNFFRFVLAVDQNELEYYLRCHFVLIAALIFHGFYYFLSAFLEHWQFIHDLFKDGIGHIFAYNAVLHILFCVLGHVFKENRNVL